MREFRELLDYIVAEFEQCKFNPINPTNFKLDALEKLREIRKYNRVELSAHIACSEMLVTEFY